MNEEQQILEEAMKCVETGSANHWPTVSGILADEITRLRAQSAKAAELAGDLGEAIGIEIAEGNELQSAIDGLFEMRSQIDEWRELAEAEGQDALYVVLDTNTGRPESEFVEIENAEGFSVKVFSVIDSGGFRRIGPLYTHPAPAKVPDKNTVRDLFYKYHNESYNPASEHYRFEHFWKAMLKSQGGE